jgi:hypothetical protein
MVAKGKVKGNSPKNVTNAQSAGSRTKTLEHIAGNGQWAHMFHPVSNLDQALTELRADLTEVPVLNAAGKVSNVYHKLETESCLKREDIDAIWHCLTLVRQAYQQLEQANKDNAQAGYQWNMNWKHTRAELDQVLEAARILQLSPEDTRDAIIASIFSDSVKERNNFIIHNIHGAQAAVEALKLVWDLKKEAYFQSAHRINLAVKQHQVAPPEFMARTVANLLCRENELGNFNHIAKDMISLSIEPRQGKEHPSRLKHVVLSIYAKIKDPFNPAHLTPDFSHISFTTEEHQLLSAIGIENWYVPHPELASSRIAHALIAGDHSINYNNPEGFAKIVLIRGPHTEAFFEDATIYDSLESAMTSFADSFNVLLPEVKPLALKGIRRTHAAVRRVLSIMTELLSGITVGPRDNSYSITGRQRVEQATDRAQQKNPEWFQFDQNASSDAGLKYYERSKERVGNILHKWYTEYGGIPFRHSESGLVEPGPGKLPFWNVPLKYPSRDSKGNLQMDSLTVMEQTQFSFAMRIREIAVELLRAEQWFY